MYRELQFKDLLQDRRILVAGYGREGQSTHALLRRLLPGQEADVARNDEEIFEALAANHYDLVIKSPGIPTMKFEGRCNLDSVTSQTDLFLQVYGDQTLAVTGTKGKSTTTALLHHLLKNSLPDRHVVLAGNMGIPLFDILDDIDEKALVVAEFSCHQLENIHRGPHVGILLNLYQEHLDHYHDYRGYQMAKMQMVLRMDEHDHCFYCTDSLDLRDLMEELKPSISATLHPYNLALAQSSEIARWPSPLKGNHNLCNIYAAVQAASIILGNDPAQLSTLNSQLSTFKGLPHRMELVGTFNGITFYNDSISTIPEAAIAAVKALRKVDTLILGGFDRGIDYHALGDFLDRDPLGRQVHNIVFVGQAGRRMMQEWNIQDRNALVEDDYSLIVPWCYTYTDNGRICLLSPAAASYDAFKNFEERGRVFTQLVKNFTPGKSVTSPFSDIRHDLHDHPQTAGNEQYAHDLIVSHLQNLHPDKVYTHVGGYGVIAVWGKDPAAKTVAFRADTDALPTGHHCGHDGHTTILLRLAELIDTQFSTLNSQFSTLNTLLLWQPAEETGEGARAVLESGILQQYNIKAFYALHNLPGYPLGTVVLCPHTFAAASTGVIYHLQGRETHASTPELGINPGLAVSEIVQFFDKLNGTKTTDLDFRQSTLICIRVGHPAFGTSAGEADVMFTLRAFSTDAMERLLFEANQAVDGIAARHGLHVQRMLQEPFRATENNGDCVEAIEKAAEEVPLRVRYQMEPNRWSEDFAEYLIHFPGAMFGIGAGEEHPELHHPDYDFPDALIEPAAGLFYNLI